MNIVGIDPSLTSTGMCINGKYFFNYAKESYMYNKSGLNKWYKLCEDKIKYRVVDSMEKSVKDFTDSEINKLLIYEKITNQISKDIYTHIDRDKDIRIYIEGYSYSNNFGPLIDLVTLGTLLRLKMLNITNYVNILPPSTLKLETAKMTYKGVKEKSKIVYRNNEGTSGGAFNKHDMYKSIIENKHEDKWVNFLKEIKDDVLSSKKIQKPIEDVNDSYLLYRVGELLSKK